MIMNPKQQKNMLFILIPSTIVIVAWVGFGIYNKAVTSTITKAQHKAIAPIAPNFDQSVFELLKKRTAVTPVLTVDEIVVTPASVPTSSSPAELTPTVEPTQVASEGATGQGGRE